MKDPAYFYFHILKPLYICTVICLGLRENLGKGKRGLQFKDLQEFLYDSVQGVSAYFPQADIM